MISTDVGRTVSNGTMSNGQPRLLDRESRYNVTSTGPSATTIVTEHTVQKGVSSARSDDTKGLKGAILDWIVPHGQSLHPPIARNVKID